MVPDEPTLPIERVSDAAGLEAETLLFRSTGLGSATATPREIGPYRLVERLGAGGMGEVWLAEQSEPVKRQVAIKLIKNGSHSREIISRFEAERQALALMNHPNIAKILDAGATSAGEPYFVMEWVNGQPLTEYCSQRQLNIEERLKLFADVCAGVQHAHQKGVIHRDLKPGNIIVGEQDGQAVPKIIDFGLAKALENSARLSDQSLMTGIGQILGTLKYMSPEQASLDNVDIDTRSDIYSLGVILYELLTGSTPLDSTSLKGQAALQVLEAIREREPLKPSSQLLNLSPAEVTELSGRCRTDSLRLRRILVGDLDWIVMKALEKERERRYDTATDLASDVRRYLLGEPVVARPPSFSYRWRKFVWKNRVGVTAAGLVTLAFVGGFVATTLLLFRAMAAEELASQRWNEAMEARRLESIQRASAQSAQARAEAETKDKELALAEQVRQREFAEAVAEFVENDFLALTSVRGQADFRQDRWSQGLGKDTTLLELLDRAAEKLRLRQNLAPEIEARLCSVIGRSYELNGNAEQGLPFLQRAFELYQAHTGPDADETLASLAQVAAGYHSLGQFDQAIALLLQATELTERKVGPDHTDTLTLLSNLAGTYRSAGRNDKALPLLEQNLASLRSAFGPEHPITLHGMNNLALVYESVGQLEKALPLYEQTRDLRVKTLGDDHPDTLVSMNSLALAYHQTAQPNKALPLMETTLRVTTEQFGEAHPYTLNSMNSLALGYSSVGQMDRAIALYEQAYEQAKLSLGLEHPDTLNYMGNLAVGYRAVGQLVQAIPLLEQVLELRRTRLGSDHPLTLLSLGNLAAVLWQAGQLERSVPLFESLLPLQESKLGRAHPNTQITVANLGVNYKDAGRIDEAIPLLEEAVESSRTIPNLSWVKVQLLAAYVKGRRTPAYQSLMREVLAETRNSLAQESLELSNELVLLADQCLELSLYDQAAELLRECVVIREKLAGDAWVTFNAQSMLGGALLATAKAINDPDKKQELMSTAEEWLVSGYEGMVVRQAAIPPSGLFRLSQAIERLVELYRMQGNAEQLERYQKVRQSFDLGR